jgi:arylsulfatase A-like enzyme
LNVPFLLSHPDLEGGRETHALMSQVDVAPTLLSLVGKDDTVRHELWPDIAGLDMSGALSGGVGPRDATGVLLNVGNIVFLDPAVQRRQAQGMPAAQAFASRDLSLRGMARGVFDGRYKFVRWFAANDHHIPADFEELCHRNDLELYDTAADPFEIGNLAQQPTDVRKLLSTLSHKCNALIAGEIGHDDGCIVPN